MVELWVILEVILSDSSRQCGIPDTHFLHQNVLGQPGCPHDSH